jgi:tetratricopeptide (TPR) repeat protein/transcriptional regulator with XRE-family HTH domain
VARPPVTFAGLLRKLRMDAGLTQEELAEAASLSSRSISDLERGVNQTARKETARLLADALHLAGPARLEFEAVARGRIPADESPAGLEGGADSAGFGGVAAPIRTLPRDVASFSGREPELREVLAAMTGADRSSGVVEIHVIGGMAGVGKTALAVHAAHQLASRFLGGQIFLPLHGHTPGRRPVDPADALANLLLTLGMSVQQIPSGLEARMALWRDRLATRRLLLVLDDAANSEQIRPLLPGTGGSLVLVTSRGHLGALEEARTISLDILPPDEAAELFVRLAARHGLSSDDVAVSEIARLSGYLPLAIGLLARQLHHHAAWCAGDLAADLAEARERLELMQTENLSVAAAFNLSYEDLTEAQQRLFRRLGLHPGTDVDVYAAAALNGTDVNIARRHLEALYDQYMLTEPARGRYRLHDLIREHSRTLAICDPDDEREQAADRLLDYYQHTAETADRYITRYSRRVPSLAAAPPKATPKILDSKRALLWTRTERPNLTACLDQATRSGQHSRVVAFTAAMASLLRHDGPWTDAMTRHSTAVEAARSLGDRLAEVSALHDLGAVQNLAGDYPGATEALEKALSIARDLDDRLGQANILNELGSVRRRTGAHPGAAEALEKALGIARDLDDRLGQASMLNNLGALRWQEGDYQAAAEILKEALGIACDLDDRLGKASTLTYLGAVGYLVGDYPRAAEALKEALGIARDLDDRVGQVSALNYIGALRYMTGDYSEATEALEEALGIARDLGDRLRRSSILNVLGTIWRRTGNYSGAAEALEEALGISCDLGDQLGESNVLNSLGLVRRRMGDYSGAAEALERALEIGRELSDPLVEANALTYLGGVRRMTGSYLSAADNLNAALRIFRDLGDLSSEAMALNELGTLHRVRGDLSQAQTCHARALEFAHEEASVWDEAHALAGLGRCALASGDKGPAEANLRRALEIFQRMGDAEAADVAVALDAC